MNRFTPSLALFAFAYLLTVVPVHAQANRTFVSAHGDDGNACSITAPCRTMQGAYNATNPGGEIDVLDPAGYGAITISKAISIQGHGWASMSTPAGGPVINITTSAKIMLQGLIIDGFGHADQGILIATSGEISVLDSTVRDTVQAGIAITSNSEVHVTIANTVVADNQGDGIAVQGSGAGITGLSLDHVQLVHNGLANLMTGAGLRATGGNAAFGTTVINSSVISANPIGIVLSQTGANAVTVFAVNSRIVNNQTSANIGTGTFLILERTSMVSLRNPITNNGQIVSYGNNVIRDSITGNGLTSASPGLR
jgi:hypothetical protein